MTLSRWLADPQFAAAVEERCNDIMREWRRYPRRLIRQAYRALETAMTNGGAAGVRAALSVLGNFGLIKADSQAAREDKGPMKIVYDFVDDSEPPPALPPPED